MIPLPDLLIFAAAALLPTWLAVQRYVTGFVLGGLALRLMLEQRRAA